MTQQASIGQEQADRLSARLQAFYDALPADEQPLMRAILARAQGDDDVSGQVMQGGCIIEFPFPIRTPPTFPTGDPFAGGTSIYVKLVY